MSLTPSTMLELGTKAPDFCLPDTEGNTVCLDQFATVPALLVVFMCNHCPYVIHIRGALAGLIKEYQAKGLAAVGINSNDADNYPDDAPDKMAEAAKQFAYTFPYLFDEDQRIAQAYKAACTPDLYLFDNEQKLVYRGQFDDSRPNKDIPVTGNDLRAAINAALSKQPIPAAQKPSMGCNIKWKAGNEPDYYG